jgi:hypothetical protein
VPSHTPLPPRSPCPCHPAVSGGTGPASAAGASSATDLHSWVSLLTGRGGANLAAASLQLPAGAASTSGWHELQQADGRTQGGSRESGGNGGGGGGGGEASGGGGGEGGGGGGGSGGAGSHGYPLSTLENVGVLTPGSPALAMDPAKSLAESIVLRGARAAGGGAAAPAAAAAALDAALRSEPPRRCVVHRAAAAAPLAVPLPFPGLFGPAVGRDGDVVAEWSPAASTSGAALGPAAGGRAARGGRHVASCPALTRVTATSEFQPWLRARAEGLRRGAGSVAGRGLAEGWGYGRGELGEVQERLAALAGSYSEAASDDGLDD